MFIYYQSTEDSQRIKHGMVFKVIASHNVRGSGWGLTISDKWPYFLVISD